MVIADAIMTTGLVTRSILEGYLHCKYLAHLRLGGREGVRSDYENAVHEVRRERCLAITESLRARYAKQGMALRVSITRAELRKGANLILDAEMQDDTFRVRCTGSSGSTATRIWAHSTTCRCSSRKRAPFIVGKTRLDAFEDCLDWNALWGVSQVFLMPGDHFLPKPTLHRRITLQQRAHTVAHWPR